MAENPGMTTMPTPVAEPRYLGLLIFTVVTGALGALLAGVAVGALLTFASAPVGFAVGLLLFGLGLPLFLALRAAAALKRRGRGVLVRRLVVLFLVGATQLAVSGAILQYSARTTGHLAMTAWEVLERVGPVPVVSDLLFAHAERSDVAPRTPRPAPGAGAGPDAGPGEGPAASGDAGSDRGGAADTGDGNATTLTPEGAPGGVPTTSSSDGAASGAPAAAAAHAAAAVAARPPAPPTPRTDVGLSPRTPGKPARTVAAAVRTAAGDSAVLVATVGAGGVVTWRTVKLDALDKLGDVTTVEVSDDGHVAIVLGGAHLVVAPPGRGQAAPVKALSPGRLLGKLEVQAVRDVVVGPGGNLLAVADVLAPALQNAASDVLHALVAIPAGPGGPGAPQLLRKSGDQVPDASTDSTVATSWSLKKGSGAGSVLVVESFADGGADLAPRLSGEVWTVNPQRLLVVKLDAPKALVELARSGTEPAGISDVELQLFGDAWLLPDGGALVDANFLERSADGWLFVVRQGSGLRALAAEQRDTDGAPWPRSGTRARSLEATSDGAFVFRRADGAAVLASIERPTEATAVLLGADAIGPDGGVVGTIASVDVPVLARGGAWVLASVRLKTARGTHDALVLASREDLANGKAEVILEVGRTLPGDKPRRGAGSKPESAADGAVVQGLRFHEGREELLWQR